MKIPEPKIKPITIHDLSILDNDHLPSQHQTDNQNNHQISVYPAAPMSCYEFYNPGKNNSHNNVIKFQLENGGAVFGWML